MAITPKIGFERLWPVLLIGLLLIALTALVYFQYHVTRAYADEWTAALKELRSTQGTSLADEKLRQEALKLRLDNQQRVAFFQSMLGTASTGLGILVALSGVWMAFAQYMTSKERDRLDRASKELEILWQGITSREPGVQAAAIATLQYFVSDDKRQHHDRVAAALALVSRMTERAQLTDRTLVPIVELAMRKIAPAMRRVSWQGARLQGANFSGVDLSEVDFRDSDLTECNFAHANLTRARFDAAKLVRTTFEHANLSGASLEYADLGDGNFRSANLTDANFRHVRLMNLQLDGANLFNAKLTLHDTDWRLAKQWRTAAFRPEIEQRLLTRYGPKPKGPRVLMLVPEFVPSVSGGLWTAVYHLLHRLRAGGADISVAVPLAPKDVSLLEFGNEIPLFPLGGDGLASEHTFTTYAKSSVSTEAVRESWPAATYGIYGITTHEKIAWFSAVVLEAAEKQVWTFDVVHAHDWPMFAAAERLAAHLRCPWVAHFHSLERDRNPEAHRWDIEQIERHGCRTANAIVAPSQFTRRRLEEIYGARSDKIAVVPNCLSEGGAVPSITPSNRKKRKVVFLGRLTAQKGPDYFVQVARELHRRVGSTVSFDAYGTGDMLGMLQANASIPEQREFYVPPPQHVRGSIKDSVQRISSPVHINKIAPAQPSDDGRDIDPQTIQPLIVRTEKHQNRLTDFVLETGFTAYALMSGEYSHAIELTGELPQGANRWYCIDADGLERVKARVVVPSRRVAYFHNEIAWKDRKNALKGASVLLVPSRIEPFGMVVLEAMEEGIPVLFSDTAGVGEVIDSGLRIVSNDIDDVSSRILELLDDEAQWEKQAHAVLTEATSYPDRRYEKLVMKLWTNISA